MTSKASSDEAAPYEEHRPSRPAQGHLHSLTEPLRDWVELGDGRWACHVSAEDRREAVLLPLPASHQAVRLLDLDGKFHILTGRVDDDHAMKVVAEDVIAGF